MPVTADSTLWTADTTRVTADGRIICIDADVAEPVRGPVPTADTTLYTSDNTTWPTADGGIVSGASDSVDAEVAVIGAAGYILTGFDVAFSITPAVVTGYVITGSDAAFSITPATTTGYVITGFDATFVIEPATEAVAGGGGAYYPRRRPLPVVGIGYGILPQLWGEAHGVVGVAGQSAAQVLVRAAGVGACGQAGDATATLKALTVAAHGAVGARGSGSGMIVKFSGSAIGRHDDDEAVVIAFLLAA